MPNQNGDSGGVGYGILDLRIKTLEREIQEVKLDLKEQAKNTTKGINEVHDRVDGIALLVNEVKLLITNFMSTQKDMKESFNETQKEMKDSLSETTKELKEDIKKIAESAGKDNKWIMLTKEIIKAIILLAGIVATGKWFG